jgi:hypothetical protein
MFGIPAVVPVIPTPHPSSAQSLNWWKDILYFDVPAPIVAALALRNMQVQTIPGAYAASPINFDYYPVTVNRWPTTEAGVPLNSAEALLEHMRLNLNQFVDPAAGEFSPYPSGRPESLPTDAALWPTPAPLGVVLHIELRVFNQSVLGNPDDASVVVSSKAPNHFQFSTLTTPADHGHPVSGHRRFGFGINSGPPVTFFAAGVDRLHSQFDYVNGRLTFGGGDKFWRSWQNGFARWVQTRTGDPSAAAIGAPISNRYDYADVVARYPR